MITSEDDPSIGSIPEAEDAPSGTDQGTSGSEGSDWQNNDSLHDFDPFGGSNTDRFLRATGGDDFSNLADRSTGQSNRLGDLNRENSLDSNTRESSFNLLGERTTEPTYHLLNEPLGSPTSPFDLGLTDPMRPGERASDWVGGDGTGSLGGYGDALRVLSDVVAGGGDFFINYHEMIAANFIGVDRYFHCMANCEASQRGPGGEFAANVISTVREATDVIKNVYFTSKPMSWSDSIADCRGDLAANRVGREAGHAGERCFDACRSFRPKGY